MENIKGAQPITFNSKTYNKDLVYFTTPKLDGLRCFIHINNLGEVFVYTKKNTIKKKIVLPKKILFYKNTILDVEYYNNKYTVFDILIYKNKDIRCSLSLQERINIIKEMIYFIKSKKLRLADYHMTPTTSINALQVYKEYKDFFNYSIENALDGIVFTPNIKYCDYFNKTTSILKWKPKNLITIDFQVNTTSIPNIFTLLDIRKKPWKPSIPKIIHYFPKNYFPYIKIVSPFSINNEDVIEFAVKNKKFIPIRKRTDKDHSNAPYVINSNLLTILDSNSDDFISIITAKS